MLFEPRYILRLVGGLMCIFGGLVAGKYKDKKGVWGGVIALIGLQFVLFT